MRTPEAFVRNSTWQVADVRAGNDRSTGKNEAYIMNRKKKENTVLRKKGNVYVLDLIVKVPSDTTAPINNRPMEVDAISQVADGGKGGE